MTTIYTAGEVIFEPVRLLVYLPATGDRTEKPLFAFRIARRSLVLRGSFLRLSLRFLRRLGFDLLWREGPASKSRVRRGERQEARRNPMRRRLGSLWTKGCRPWALRCSRLKSGSAYTGRLRHLKKCGGQGGPMRFFHLDVLHTGRSRSVAVILVKVKTSSSDLRRSYVRVPTHRCKLLRCF